MMRDCVAWLERVLSGGGGAPTSGGAANPVATEPLRICFDATTEGAVEADAGGYDLVIVPAVWHRRSELLASVAALLRQSGRRHRVTVELSVAHDEADRRLATQCDALIQGSGGRSELRVQRL